MVKTVLITNYWKNSNGGGVKTYVVNLVEALKNKGEEVNVIFRWGDDPEHICGGRNKIVFVLTSYRQLKKIRPEVIYSQGTWYCLLPGVLYKNLHGCTLIHTFHTEPNRKLFYPAKIFFQNLLNTCDCVTFVSKGLKESIIEIDGFSFRKTAITYGGVQVRAVSPNDVYNFRKKYHIDASSPVLLVQAFTANALKAQGLRLVIQALKKNVNKYPNIVLIVTRDGKYISELKKFVYDEKVKADIIFTEDVQNPFIPIALCDVFIFPWLGRSGVGLALLEAMALGKPVIVTDNKCESEVITDGKNGIIVVPEVEKIADSIDILLKDREYSDSLGKCAKETIQNHFSWEQTAEKFIRIR